MSQNLFRLGLWAIVIAFASYVLRETFVSGPFADLLSPTLLRIVGLGGLALLAASAVFYVLEALADKARKNRCVECRTPIPRGELYCRQHLRQVVDRGGEMSRRMRLR
jgi:hypothetical protein